MKSPLLIPSLLLSLLSWNVSAEVPSHLKWNDDESFEALKFETPLLTGTFVAHDKRELGKGFGRHGLRNMSYKGHDLNAPESAVGAKRRHQGLLNLYRVYSATETFGALRDDAAQVTQLKNGARLTWPASETRPVDISATWTLTGPAQIDVYLEATPTRDITNFEILPATYLPVEFEKFTYLDNAKAPAASTLRPPANEADVLKYPFYPLSEADRPAQEQSGRIHSSWKWATIIPDDYATLPIVYGGNEEVQVVQFANPESVSAVCATPKPTTGSPEEWNSVGQHSALYFSLFGRDVAAGETVTARIRLNVIDTPENSAKTHRDLYKRFLEESLP